VVEPGLPNKSFNYNNKLIDISTNLATKFLSGKGESSDRSVFESLHSIVKSIFLLKLINEKIDQKVYESLRDLLHLHTKLNDDLASIWYQTAMKNGFSDVIPHVQDYLSRVGRMKYLRPNYKALYKLNKQEGLSTFEKNRIIYHPVAVRLIENDFKANQN